ncbi:MAG: HAD family hydrolase [Coriobacteriia bacterium]|nr:HAD family hydrolase [Coriobacteriia bacterium]
MIHAVLFDLDGTLLDIDLQGFLREYFALLGPELARLVHTDEKTALEAVMQATAAMCEPHVGRTNRSVFEEHFLKLTGADLADPVTRSTLATFYESSFPSLKAGNGPRDGAASAVAATRGHGLKCALATNPIFPYAAVAERVRWAGFSPDQFDLVTSYENSEACKPLPHYFRQIAELLGVAPDACLMVGDDPMLDMAAADVGMRTFYVGGLPGVTSTWSGSIADLDDLLTRVL